MMEKLEEYLGMDKFPLIYRGSSEVDPHYTKAMLPWIVSEIKDRNKRTKMVVEISKGGVTVRDSATKEVEFCHAVQQIHKCVVEQADPTCFLYTLKSDPLGKYSMFSAIMQPESATANATSSQNYQCHLFQASSAAEVKNFFACLRQQPQMEINSTSSSFNSLQDLSAHNESQFFEVYFVGRVKVSHSKVPTTFIDDALDAFKEKEKLRRNSLEGGRHRSISGSSVSSSNSSLNQQLLTHQSHKAIEQNVPQTNIVEPCFPQSNTADSDFPKQTQSLNSSKTLTNLATQDESDRSRSPSKEIESTQLMESSSQVHFTLWNEQDEKSPGSIADSKGTQENEKVGFLRVDSLAPPMLESFCNRLRTSSTSGEHGDNWRQSSLPCESTSTRPRSGSFGCVTQRNKCTASSDTNIKMLAGYDFNRTMLFHIGRRELQLINPEMKSVQLDKPFRVISHWCQGLKEPDHFGFICREIKGETPVYLGYVFRCETTYVAEEIMTSLSKSFAAVHEAQSREKQENLMCDVCPMKWFSILCADVEGLPAAKAHNVIMKRCQTLPEDERQLLIAKYEGVETSGTQLQNNIMMMLLRAHFECKQSNHSHTTSPGVSAAAVGGAGRVEYHVGSNIESSFRRAKKSLASSFSQLLKRSESRDAESVDRDASHHVRMEGVSDSPLGHRPRSSTIGSGDSFRREMVRQKLVNKRKEAEDVSLSTNETPSVSPKLNMFMKVGSPIHVTDHQNETEMNQTVKTAFCQHILETVSSPNKNRTIAESEVDSNLKPNLKSNGKENKKLENKKRNWIQLKILWKKSVFQQILLNRMERENQRLRVLQRAMALHESKLNYEEEEICNESIKAWQMLLSKPQARIDTNILRCGIKQGVPKNLRGSIWQLLMYQSMLKDSHVLLPLEYQTHYEEMLKELTSQHHAILLDLGRTFPTHPYFTQTLGPGQLSLFNVLKAYSLLDSSVGYCQGLSFVGGILLMHVEEDVAYDLLKHLMYIIQCRKQYVHDLIGLQVEMYQLSRLLHNKLRAVYNHLETHEVTPQLFAAPWFLTIFASQFPLGFVARVFDAILLDGMEVIFRVSLELLRRHQEKLLNCSSFEAIMNYLKLNLPNIPTNEIEDFFSAVCDMSLSRELSAYEIEYRVLQEEVSTLMLQHENELRNLKEANQNLKRQNFDLLDQLQSVTTLQNQLQVTNHNLQQGQHHLDVRIRWLEMERKNHQRLINVLVKKVSPESIASVPMNLRHLLSLQDVAEAGDENNSDDAPLCQLENVPIVPPEGNVSSRSVSLDNSLMQRYIRSLVNE